MIVLLSEQMRQLDQRCINLYHIPGIILMENAARGILEAVIQEIPDFASHDWHIFCYKGNNGGDGLALARHLLNHHCRVKVWLFCDESELNGDVLINYQIVKSIPQIQIELHPELNCVSEIRSGIIVDALLGTGLQGCVRGRLAELITCLNHLSPVKRIAIDIPSGLMADTGNAYSEVFKADFTVTMAYPKPGLLLYPGREFTGKLYIAHISQVEQAITELKQTIFLIEQEELVLPIRRAYFHKGNYGKVSLVMGAKGYYGAGMLSSRAVLKSGAGMARWYGPPDIADAVAVFDPEVMFQPLPDWSEIHSCWDQLKSWSDILAVGPGLGRSAAAENMMAMILQEWPKPLIIDADGLNNLKADQLKTKLSSAVILTPHPGEFCRLKGITFEELSENPLEIARNFAMEYGVHLVLKMVPAILAVPSGILYLNNSGNDGMATAGSGDVLTGILAGLWAQHLLIEDVMKTGVYLHGLAGDLAASALTKYCLTAGDIIHYLPQAFKTLLSRSQSCNPNSHQ